MAYLKQNKQIKLCDCELRNSNSLFTDTYNEFYGQAESGVDLLFILEHKENEWMIKEFLDEIIKQCKRNSKTYAVIYALNCTQKNYTTNDTLRPFVECKKQHVKKKIDFYKPKVILTVGKSIYTIVESKDFMVAEDKDNNNRGSHFYTEREDDFWIYSSEFNCRVYPVAPLYLFAGFDNYEKKHFKEQITRSIKALDIRQGRKTELTYEKLNKEQASNYLTLTSNNLGVKIISIDTETDGFDFINGKLNNITICTNLEPFKGYFIYWKDIDKHLLIKLFERKDIVFVFQNFNFDGKWLISNGIFNSRCDFDTMIASAHCNENNPNGLKPMTWLHTVWGGYEKELNDYIENNDIKSYADIPERILIKYASYDAIITLHLYYYLKERLKQEGEHCESCFYDIRMKAVPMLVEVSMRGLPFNINYCYSYADKLRKEARLIEEEIYSIAKMEFNLSSKKQLTEVFKSIEGFQPLHDKYGKEQYTKTGDLILNKETLGLYAEMYPFAKKIVDYNHIKKEISQLGFSKQDEIDNKESNNSVSLFKNKFIQKNEDDLDLNEDDFTYDDQVEDTEKGELKEKGLLGSVHNNRLYGGYNLIGTKSGRMSSSGGLRSSVNFQNFSKKIEFRKLFVPNDGFVIMEADYKTLEVNVCSQLAGSGALERVLLDRMDMHSFTATTAISIMDEKTLLQFFNKEELSSIFHKQEDGKYKIDYNDFVKYATDETLVKKNFSDFRKHAKFVNFSSLYNTTRFGIARLLNVELDVAQQFLDAFYNSYPEVKKLIESSIKEAKEKGFLQTPLGLKRRFNKMTYSKVSIENASMEERLKRTSKNLYSIMQGQYNTSTNFRVQSLAGMTTIISMIEIEKIFKEREFKSVIIANVHDSIVFECCVEEINEVIKIVNRVMTKKRWENVGGNKVELQVDFQLSATWGFGKSWDYWKNHLTEWEDELKYIKDQNLVNREFRA